MKVRYRPSALRDLERIRDYIARDNPHVAHTVVERVRSAVERLSAFPRSGRSGFVLGLSSSLCRSCHIVVYRIAARPAGEFVDILAVVHGARKRPIH